MLGLLTLTGNDTRSIEETVLRTHGRETKLQTRASSGPTGVVDISPEKIAAMTEAVKQPLSQEIERSNKHYYEEVILDSQREFDKIHVCIRSFKTVFRGMTLS